MDLCRVSCLPVRPSCKAKTLMLDSWTLHVNFSTTFFPIPSILIGNIDFYHFISHPLNLTLAGGHKVSA